MKKLVYAIALCLTTLSAHSSETSDSGQGSGSGVSNIENQTLIYEHTTAGKIKAEWMKGRTIKPDCTPAMNRVGWAEGCK